MVDSGIEIIECGFLTNKVEYNADLTKYNTIEELLTMEGTRYTLSSTNDFNDGVKSINSIKGYKDAIKRNGVYAIHIDLLIDK